MIGEAPATLADFGHLKCSTFLNRRNLIDLQEPFWNLIYDGITSVPLRVARQVAIEVQESDKRVRDVIDGWRPEALR